MNARRNPKFSSNVIVPNVWIGVPFAADNTYVDSARLPRNNFFGKTEICAPESTKYRIRDV